jgi:hypothetical protein
VARAYENFFRVAEDTLERTIYAWTVDGRITLRLDRSPVAEVYVEADVTGFWTIGGSVAAAGALRIGRYDHVLWLRGGYQDDRPTFNVGDVVRTADIIWAEGDYAYRPGSSWELGLDGRAARVSFESAPGNGSDLYLLGGHLRWLGFGSRLSPEVGGRVGWQRAENPNQEDIRADVHARLVLVPVAPLWLSVRYRHRFRSYIGADPASSNFERWDEGRQWTSAAAVRVTRNLQLDLYYDHLEMDSTRPERIFSTRMVTVGITLRH